MSQLGGFVNRLRVTKKIPLPHCIDNNADSIVEDESSIVKLHLDDSLVRADEEYAEVIEAHTPIIPNFRFQQQKSHLGSVHDITTGKNKSHQAYIRIETSYSHENSPRCTKDLVERVIEDNFNWTKYCQLQ